MTPSTQYYFAYGSNMSKEQMLNRTGSLPESSLARLNGYRFAFRKLAQSDECYADIIPGEPSSFVYGVLYDCSQEALRQLDIFEGVAERCYRREKVDVVLNDTGDPISAIAYIGDDGFSTIEGNPSQEYLGRILKGSAEHGVAQDYIEFILKCSGLDAKIGQED